MRGLGFESQVLGLLVKELIGIYDCGLMIQDVGV